MTTVDYGCSKINDLQTIITFLIDQNVFRLYISMNDVELMAIGKSLKNLQDNIGSFLLCENDFSNNFIKQFSSLA